MSVVHYVLLLLIPAWVVVYTLNFARYLWKRKFVRGAVATLTLTSVGGVGAVVFFYHQVYGM